VFGGNIRGIWVRDLHIKRSFRGGRGKGTRKEEGVQKANKRMEKPHKSRGGRYQGSIYRLKYDISRHTTNLRGGGGKI